jgi:signal peptidase II
MGNLYDRLRWDRGVVDFIGPLDLGFWYFPIFNVADIAITCGAVMLAISFWMEERREAMAEQAASQGAATTASGDERPDAAAEAVAPGETGVDGVPREPTG